MRIIIATMLITAYTPGAGYPNGGPLGAHCHRGQCTVLRTGHAACGRGYPFHTVFVVEGQPYECVDRGGAITNDRLDLVFPDLRSAYKWGVRRRRVKVWPPGTYWRFQRELEKLEDQ